MSIADHFDRAPDAGFVRSYDSRAARRQFQVSLVLIVILTVSAFALGLLVRFDPPAGISQTPAAAQHDVHFAGVMPDLSGFAPRS
ncbi:hypothetical protein [uncultured Methylovirgula sp.]|uniref:hypothetical protein n=1 Tax=uncultured Methylovirgula sp. TaxID=1285960 RepID=UPI00260482F8|nr:hypothetical protein [uncultured Methylovirgula sp.]